MSVAVGIDFGTSNSTCAVWDGTHATLVPLEDGKPTLPSALFFDDGGQNVLFGRTAIQAYVDGEHGRLMRGLKSILGTALMQERTQLGKRNRSFVDVLSIYIAHLKRSAEQYAGRTIDRAVMGRPVHFHDNDEAADAASQTVLHDIARAVGFKEVTFQYEPIAAAFAHEAALTDEALALVVDLGGGTSDFALVRLGPQRMRMEDRSADILATTGVRVGGTNFDKTLSMRSFMRGLGLGSEYTSEFADGKWLPVPSGVYAQLSDWPRVRFAETEKALRETRDILRGASEPAKIERLLKVQQDQLGHAVLGRVEAAKIGLSDADDVTTSFADMGLPFRVIVRRTAFEKAIAPDLHRIETAMTGCIHQAGITAAQIDLVVLTGGSSELPVINALVRGALPHARVSAENKLASVGLGLGHSALFRR